MYVCVCVCFNPQLYIGQCIYVIFQAFLRSFVVFIYLFVCLFIFCLFFAQLQTSYVHETEYVLRPHQRRSEYHLK